MANTNNYNEMNEINTGATEFRYAGFWIRLLALIIDGLITCLISWLFIILSLGAGALIPVSLLYVVIFNGSVLSSTPGKALLGLQVTDHAGNRITYMKSLFRYLVQILFFWTNVIMLFNRRRKTAADYAAESIVIYRQPPNVSYFNAWWEGVKEVTGFLKSLGEQPSTAERQVDKNTETQDQRPSDRGQNQRERIYSELQLLYKLYLDGALNEQEYEKKKAELLAQL